MRKLFGVSLFISALIAAILYGSPITIFIDPPSLIFVFGLITGSLICRHSFIEILSFNKDVSRTIINSSLLSGATGFVIGLIEILQYMNDPTSFGPAMAINLCTLFYSLLIGLITYLFSTGLQVAPTKVVKLQPLRFFVGLIIILLSVTGCILYHSSFAIFFDLPSAMLILFFLAGGVIARHPLQELIEFSPKVVKSIMYSSYIGGAIGTLIGFIQMLQNMSDPSAIGPAMAVALLTIFYSLVISFAAYLVSKANDIHFEALAIGVGSSLACLIPFFIMLIFFATKN